MKFHIAFAMLFFTVFGVNKAVDPFEGFYQLYCFKGRDMKGCPNETLAQMYLKTEAAQSDQIFSEPNTLAYLYTRSNPQNPEPLHECGGRLPSNTVYRSGQNTQVLMTGYMSSACGFAYFREMKDQLLYRDDYNVILIDSSWSQQLDYYSTVRDSKLVGKQIAFLLENIVDQTGATGERFHLIGHSVGAHVAGAIGRYFKRGQIRRITGLDPAGPGFINKALDDRLDKTDAKMVDVIHGNSGGCLPYALGDFNPLGHADFYPNGGTMQLSSFSTIIPRLLKKDIIFALGCLYTPLCFHFQVPEYFKASINPCNCQFIGVECNNYDEFMSKKCRSCGSDGNNCAVMGMDWELYPQKEGNHSYYLDTSLHCPYCDNTSIQRGGFPTTPTNGDTKRHCFVPSSRP